jgi:hypothetical protein
MGMMYGRHVQRAVILDITMNSNGSKCSVLTDLVRGRWAWCTAGRSVRLSNCQPGGPCLGTCQQPAGQWGGHWLIFSSLLGIWLG